MKGVTMITCPNCATEMDEVSPTRAQCGECGWVEEFTRSSMGTPARDRNKAAATKRADRAPALVP